LRRVSKVFKKLVGGEVDGFVVLNREGGAAGILTTWDFVKTRRWYKGSGTPRPLFGTRVTRGESRHVGVTRLWRIMSRGVATATLDTPIEDVARYMMISGIYVVPVVTNEGKVIGAVTAWDVFHAYLYGPKEGREDVEVKKAIEEKVEKPTLETVVRLRPSKHVTGLRVKDVMVTDIPAVNVRDTLSRIRKMFLKNGTTILAVVDDEGKVVGFVTRRDFITYIAEKSLGYWKRQKGKLLALKEQTMPGERVKIMVEEGTAGEIMKTQYPTAGLDATVEEIAYKMLAAGSDYVVVVDEANTPIGVVTKDELLKAFKERGRDVKVGELMTPAGVAATNLFSSLASVIKKINAYELDGVVVTEGNELKGVINVDDLSLRPIEETLRGERLVFFTKSGIRRVATSGLEKLRYSKVSTLTAYDVMRPIEYTTTADADAKKVVDKLFEQGVVPVLDEKGRLVGVLNKMDVVKELARVYITYAMPEKVAEVEKKIEQKVKVEQSS
jgi:CBS domain-containing protein